MRIYPLFWRGFAAPVSGGLMVCILSGCKPAVKPSGPPAAPKPAVAAPAAPSATNAKQTTEYVSFFDELMPPKGRDPFYPNSHRRDPVPVAVARPDKPASLVGDLRLQGIVGTASHRMAIINGTSFDAGEQDTIRVPNGRIKVKCLEIGEDYAVVLAEGEAQPKRLDLSKKGF
jgi:hypothetical protein